MIQMKFYVLLFLSALFARLSTAQEVIPFILKEDNRIYVKGVINESDSLDLIFDLGANITVINKTRMEVKNAVVRFDTIVSNIGGNGTSNEELSLSNQVSLGSQVYEYIEILGIAYPESEMFDGIIGWNFFQDKIVRINFESMELEIHSELPELSNGYSKCKLKFLEEVPYMEFMVFNGKKKVKFWAMLDTGNNGILEIYYSTAMENDLSNAFQVIGASTSVGTDGNVSKSDLVLIPKTNMGGFEIYNMPVNMALSKTDSSIPALMGGNLLKRFHMVLDFENELVYLKPNYLINSEF